MPGIIICCYWSCAKISGSRLRFLYLDAIVKHRSARFVLLSFLVIFCGFLPGRGAVSLEFSVERSVPAPIDNTPDRHHYIINATGLIVDGDLDKLRGFLKSNSITLNTGCEDAGCDGDAVSLFLDSPGGNFREALRIAKFLTDYQPVNTVVERDGACLSSCAIIFMAGDKRMMFAGARVGFHAPFLPPEIARLGQAGDIYKASVKSVAELVDVSTQIRFSARLLSHMLSVYGRDAYFYIDTIDKAGRWGIDVAGLPAVTIDQSRLVYACFNMTSWASDQFAIESFPLIEGGFSFGLGSSPSFSQIGQYWVDQKFVTSKADATTVTGTVNVRYAGEGTFSDCRIEVRLKDGRADLCKVSTFSNSFVDCSGRPELPTMSGLWSDEDLARHTNYHTMFFPPEYRLDARKSTESGLSDGVQSDAPKPKDLPADTEFSATLKATDLSGTDIGLTRNTTQMACKQQCSGMATCDGYTFDRWNRLCILKSDVRYSRLEPKAVSEIKGTTRIPRSSQQIAIQIRKGRAFPGDAYSSNVVASIESCRMLCMNDKDCLAFNYDHAGRNCSLFDDPGEYGAKPKMSVGIKFQPAQ